MKFNIIKQLREHKKEIIKLLYKVFKILIYTLMFTLLMFIFINEMNSIKTFNYEAFVIVSESMEPKIKVGDIVIIKKTSKDNIKENDIITFEKNNESITHRVIEIKEQNGENLYITKGDNNQVEDIEEVHYFEIKGVKIAKIPYAGLLILKLSKQKNFIIVLMVFILLYRTAIKKDNKKRDRIKKKRIEDEKIFKDN